MKLFTYTHVDTGESCQVATSLDTPDPSPAELSQLASVGVAVTITVESA